LEEEMSDHPIVHIEISAEDPNAAGKFYSDVFGWKITEMPEMNYAVFEDENGLGGGFNPISEDYPLGTIMVYIYANDIEAMLEKIIANGGKVLSKRTEIPGIGWYALFKDPTGNTLALYKRQSQEE
jgi:predicted enzyme related to lactoylglutathione lyase